MADSLRESDLQKLVELVETSRGELAEVGLPQMMLQSLNELVPCDEVSFLEMDPLREYVYLDQGLTQTLVNSDSEEGDPFWLHYWDSLCCSYPTVSGDLRTITTISDFYSRRERHSTAMYREAVPSVEHEAMLCLNAPTSLTRRLLFVRCGGSDFDARERVLLALLRPQLNEFYQDLQRRRQPQVPLTARQHQLMRLVALGYTNKDIARDLVVSAATVRTHLENIFRQLGVTTRSAAAARVFPIEPY